MSKKEHEQTTRIMRVTVSVPEKDVKKRMDQLFTHMLEGLSKMLAHWGDFECKGGGVIDPKEALFHCRACICNGIRNHVDQAIERLKRAE